MPPSKDDVKGVPLSAAESAAEAVAAAAAASSLKNGADTSCIGTKKSSNTTQKDISMDVDASGAADNINSNEDNNPWPAALEAVMKAVDLRDAAQAAAAASAEKALDGTDVNMRDNDGAQRESGQRPTTSSKQRVQWDRFSRSTTDGRSSALNLKSCCKDAFHGRACNCTDSNSKEDNASNEKKIMDLTQADNSKEDVTKKKVSSQIGAARYCCRDAMLLGHCDCSGSSGDAVMKEQDEGGGDDDNTGDAGKSKSRRSKYEKDAKRSAAGTTSTSATGSFAAWKEGRRGTAGTNKPKAPSYNYGNATKPRAPPHAYSQPTSSYVPPPAPVPAQSQASYYGRPTSIRQRMMASGAQAPAAAANDADVQVLRYYAPEEKTLPPGLSDIADVQMADSVCRTLTLQEVQGASTNEEHCKICLDPIVSLPDVGGDIGRAVSNPSVVCLKICGHKFHHGCIREAMKHHASHKCPECRVMVLPKEQIPGSLQGNMPSGTMTVCTSIHEHCAGYEDEGSIIIAYDIPPGRQRSYHPHPGKDHGSAYRTCFLPFTPEGQALLCRLKFAFLHGLTFTVGKSLTSGFDHSVTWASIHHKTSPIGGSRRHGFPDEGYLKNCNAELDSIGVPSLEACRDYVKAYNPPLAASIAATRHAMRHYGLDLGPNQMLLFHLIHAEHCMHDPSKHNGAQCSIVTDCQKIKVLRQHVKSCSDDACTFDLCKRARDVLAHFNTRPCSVGGGPSDNCLECGTVKAAITGAKSVGDDIAKMREQDILSYTRLSRRSQVDYEAEFFFEQKLETVFGTDNSSQCPDPLASLMGEIKSESFLNFASMHGIEESSVELNPHITATSHQYKAFVQEGMSCLPTSKTTGDVRVVGDNGNSIDTDLFVRIVFHGTSPANVESILKNGLDPTKRRGQVHGQGEYFASNPAMPVGYCRGGHELLVFAVISGKRDVRTDEIVVVKEQKRQLPIATLHFKNLTQLGWDIADKFQRQLKKLEEEKKEKDKLAQEARQKEKITRLIFQGEYMSASDLYNKACEPREGLPPTSWAEEMAVYVRDHIRDDEQVDIYFPNLPPRPQDSSTVDMLNVDACEATAKDAKEKLEAYQKKMAADKQKNSKQQAGGKKKIVTNFFQVGATNKKPKH